MPDFLVTRTVRCSLVIEADTPEEALAISQGISSGEFEVHTTEDAIDPGYQNFLHLMKNNKENF